MTDKLLEKRIKKRFSNSLASSGWQALSTKRSATEGMSAKEIQRCAANVPSARAPPFTPAAMGKAPGNADDTGSSSDDEK